MAVAVRIEGVSKSFATTLALDDVSLTIEPGELFFLLGPSGCGKTTLLRAIAGFCKPDAGRIWIGDRDVTEVPAYLRDTGMVFQSYALWPHMTVRQNVAFGLELRGLSRAEIRQRVDDMLAIVHLTDRAEHRPAQLSGGQQQRVALARAAVIQPQCLLLDEPLSNLDARLRMEMRGEIRRICKQAGLTAIYVTHDQKEALSIADRLAVLNVGRICQVGAPQEVYARPTSRFVASFIGETNLLAGRLESIENSRARVDTLMGPVECSALSTPALAVGAKVAVSVRPESIRLGAGPAGTINAFPATLRMTNYLGEVAQHQLDVRGPGGAVELRAFEVQPQFVARDGATRETVVHFAPEDAIVLSD